MARISHEHGMPIDTAPRERHSATTPACRAVIGVRLHAPEHERLMLRRLRVRYMSGHLLDTPETIRAAAPRRPAWTPTTSSAGRRASTSPTRSRSTWSAPGDPMPAARVLDEKLANWSGGRRYTCPSYEICRVADDVRIAIPGFQPFAAYDVILANLVPGTERRDPPTSVAEVLDWTGTPLATREVAVVCDVTHERARELLGRVADEDHVGFDGFWTLRGA